MERKVTGGLLTLVALACAIVGLNSGPILGPWGTVAVVAFAGVIFGVGMQWGVKQRPWRAVGAILFVIVVVLADMARWLWRGFSATWFNGRQPAQPAKRPDPVVKLPGTASEALGRLRQPADVALGISVPERGRPALLTFDLADNHWLVAGSTGSGKTNLLNVILLQLLARNYGNAAMQLFLIDLKADQREGLAMWAPLLTGHANTPERARALLEWLVRIMRRRHAQGGQLRTTFLVVDEVAQLVGDKTAMRHLRDLAMMGRSANIVLVVATQHPRGDVLDAHVARNLVHKVCLPVDNASQAVTILGASPPTLLTEPGEFWVRPRPAQYVRGRAWLVTADEIAAVVNRALSTAGDDVTRLLVQHYQTGDGVNRMAERMGMSARWVSEVYRWAAETGIFKRGGKGRGYEWAVPLGAAIERVKHEKRKRA